MYFTKLKSCFVAIAIYNFNCATQISISPDPSDSGNVLKVI